MSGDGALFHRLLDRLIDGESSDRQAFGAPEKRLGLSDKADYRALNDWMDERTFKREATKETLSFVEKLDRFEAFSMPMGELLSCGFDEPTIMRSMKKSAPDRRAAHRNSVTREQPSTNEIMAPVGGRHRLMDRLVSRHRGKSGLSDRFSSPSKMRSVDKIFAGSAYSQSGLSHSGLGSAGNDVGRDRLRSSAPEGKGSSEAGVLSVYVVNARDLADGVTAHLAAGLDGPGGGLTGVDPLMSPFGALGGLA